MRWAILDSDQAVVGFSDDESRPPSSVRIGDGDGAALGRIWNGTEFVSRRWKTYEFLQRFTTSELDGCLERALSDAVTRRFLAYCESAHEVLAEDPATTAGMEWLVSSGLISSARRDEILSR